MPNINLISEKYECTLFESTFEVNILLTNQIQFILATKITNTIYTYDKKIVSISKISYGLSVYLYSYYMNILDYRFA